MSNLVRRRGTLDIVDTAVGVGVGIVAAVILLKILGMVLGGGLVIANAAVAVGWMGF